MFFNFLMLLWIVVVFLLVGLLWWLGWVVGYGVVFVFYCLMGIIDYFDGYFVWVNGVVLWFGIFFDLIVDKIMVVVVILILVGMCDIFGIYVIVVLVILLCEIVVLGLCEFLV